MLNILSNQYKIKLTFFLLILNVIIINYIFNIINENQINKNRLNLNYNEESIFKELETPIFYDEYFSDVKKKIDIDFDYDTLFENYLNDSLSLIKKWEQVYNETYQRQPPTNYDLWLNFVIENKCPIHPNYYIQIDKDLSKFRNSKNPKQKTIKLENVFKGSNITTNIGLIEIGKDYFHPINSSLDQTNAKMKHLGLLLTDDLLKIFPNKIITIAYNYHDYPRVISLDNHKYSLKSIQKIKNNAFRYNKCLKRFYSKYRTNSAFFISNRNQRLTELLPVFSSCKTICHNDILLPGYHHIRESNYFLEDEVKWKNKINKLLWRGATTGVGWRIIGKKDDYENFQRMRLVKWAMSKNELKENFPIDIDIGFTSLVNCNNTEMCQSIRSNYSFKDPMTYREHFKSKYLMVIDGHSWVSRLQPFLFSKSLSLLSTNFIEWFSFLTRPWYHYVPVDISLENLDKNLLWAYENDKFAQLIAERASKLAHKHLSLSSMKCYLGLLLLEYSDLFI